MSSPSLFHMITGTKKINSSIWHGALAPSAILRHEIGLINLFSIPLAKDGIRRCLLHHSE